MKYSLSLFRAISVTPRGMALELESETYLHLQLYFQLVGICVLYFRFVFVVSVFVTHMQLKIHLQMVFISNIRAGV